jgi:hypothetical protein
MIATIVRKRRRSLLPPPWTLPDGFMAIDKQELVSLLTAVVERGVLLGEADMEYREWLGSLLEEDHG